MNDTDDDDRTWIEDDDADTDRRSDGKHRDPRAGDRAESSRSGQRAARFDPRSLASMDGVSRAQKADLPAELLSKTRSQWFKVAGFYQLDDVPAWKAWKSRLARLGDKERWLFYGCPLSMAEEVVGQGKVRPYGEFFPRVFGRDALYLSDQAEWAARVACRFGVEGAGLVVSCRVATGKVFTTKSLYPSATNAPRGFDTVSARKGLDLGFGKTDHGAYIIYDHRLALVRYAVHVVRN